ncbi:Transposase DDE domain-containing protein [Rubrimonas cliftonensis]|uniref:Transposase DDE domain-containing protein n=1 Tax=Rubrimonas cliftonensis TaxID=89524 RepID=A0A1H4E7G5_9RHOB|nr:Transposase DDE domain-containing protein [Rubrimonas cliftonensis]
MTKPKPKPKPKPARYPSTNWSGYNPALCKRGSLLIWLDKAMAWHAPHEGRPPVFSNEAVHFCRSIKGEGRPENSPVDCYQP